MTSKQADRGFMESVRVLQAAFSPDGQRIVTVSEDHMSGSTA
jgi:hypothetical protein